MSDFSISPEEIERQEREAFAALSNDLDKKIDGMEKKIQRLDNEKKKYTLNDIKTNIYLGLGSVALLLLVFVLFSDSAHMLGIILLVCLVAFWAVRLKKIQNQENTVSELTKQLSSARQSKQKARDDMIKRIGEYRTGYYSYHSQNFAVNTSTSKAAETIAEHFGILFCEAVQNADRRKRLQIIEIDLDLKIGEKGINYTLFQNDTERQPKIVNSFLSFADLRIAELKTLEKQVGAMKAISSLIQTRLIEYFINEEPVPNVRIDKIKRVDYIPAENECRIIYEQVNPDYEEIIEW